MNSASLCILAGRYDNPIPPLFLAPIDSLKIPAQAPYAGGIDSLESIAGLVENLKYRLWIRIYLTEQGQATRNRILIC
jgi:hypothetical protein